ncbi:UNVERIFIED_CONTAM: hypothetical protein Scaly_2980700 [Sesamum calycinum]|uniref:GAG-pre-integrase domain-containing protein n=1 Tax=Sesamum calycinum TaxID=2727403 RepID=A0AAW2KKI4_9LAMI
MKRLVDLKSLEIDNLDNLAACESCLKGKMTRKPFVGQSTLANGLLDLIHTDIYGQLNTQARGGFSYFITSTNDHSRSARVPQPPERYDFLGVTGQLDNDPKTYGEAMSDIDWKSGLKP